MKICPSCGRENAEDARFCSQCGTPLADQVAAREERKAVTVRQAERLRADVSEVPA